VIYYGGKSRNSEWIIKHFPPHSTFVDVFGGGASVFLSKKRSTLDVYNDIGNVSTFFRVLRDHPQELYERLYLTPFSREEFWYCRKGWQEQLNKGNLIEWAREWFVVVYQGYAHEEMSNSWRVSRSLNCAEAFQSNIEKIHSVAERFRTSHIESLSFEKLIPMYDSESTLFYCDPPYLTDTRVSSSNYLNEMPIDLHVKLLTMLNEVKGQVVVSMYDHELYHKYLPPPKWRVDRITHPSTMHNSSSIEIGERTEVLWILERQRGIWELEAE
jgi:DNA adenine methylase